MYKTSINLSLNALTSQRDLQSEANMTIMYKMAMVIQSYGQ